jgi:hypothetical protein
MTFVSLKNWLSENKTYDNVTVLFPGGFKPLSGAHIDLIKRYARLPEVKEVKVLVGPGVRNGITQEMAMEICNTLLDQLGPKVSIEPVKYPSPILTAYKYVAEAKPGNYALASSSKGDDYKRVVDFTAQHQPGGKYASTMPEGVKVLELPLNVEPLLYNGRSDDMEGQGISASTLRKDVMNDDYKNFVTNYPNNSEEDIKNVWNALHGKLTESFVNKIFEGGNAFPETRSVSKEELHATYTYIEDTMIEFLKLSKDDFHPIGSFGVKKPEDKYGDIDVAVDQTKIKTEEKPIDFIHNAFTDNGFKAVKMPGLGQVSVEFPIAGDFKNGSVQVDLMLGKNLNWSKFSYSSPDYSKGESQYKAFYAGNLLMAIITESFKKITKKTPEGEVEEYSLLSLRLNSGIYEVTKTYMGKKGLIKTAKIVDEKFMTDDPVDVIHLAFGEKYDDINLKKNFEAMWKLINAKDFIHKTKLPLILSKYKFYLDSEHKEYPKECIQDYPEIFKQELKESAGRKLNTHMMHLEELLFEGEEGLDEIKYYLKGLNDKLKNKPSNLTLSTKIDGAPAVMVWSKFPGLKDYGLGTKTTFNKEPVTSHTSEDVQEKFGDRPDLAKKLTLLLSFIRKINVPENEIWQGDFLFDKDSKKVETIDGAKYYTFKPNTIKYAVEVDSEIGQIISKAVVGLTWHTRYTGTDVLGVKPSFNIDLDKINKVDGIYMSEPYIKTVDITKLQDTEIDVEGISTKLDKLYNNEQYQALINYATFPALIQKFHNGLIRTGIPLNKESFEKSFMDFVLKEKGEKLLPKIQSFMKANESAISILLDLIETLSKTKNKILKNLNKLAAYKTYVDLKTSQNKSVNQEGFAISSPSGGVVKIVDRAEFFYLNSHPDVIKGWEKV